MKIKSIELDGNELPHSVTLTMSLSEAILIAEFVGNLTPSTAASTSIWNALDGTLFNRFWEEGFRGAAKGDSR